MKHESLSRTLVVEPLPDLEELLDYPDVRVPSAWDCYPDGPWEAPRPSDDLGDWIL